MSSSMLLSEYPWNGNMITWFKAREAYDAGIGFSQRYLLSDAEARFKTAIAVYPKDWRFYQALGSVEMKQHKYTEAEAAFRKVTEIQKDNFDAWLAMSDCLSHDKGRLDEAEKAAKTALSINPLSSVACAQLALILQLENKTEEAKKTYNGSGRLEKDDARYWFLSGRYHQLLGDEQRMEMEYRQAADLDKSNPDYWITIGMFLFNRDDLDGAEHYLKRASYLNPYNPSLWATLGEVWRRQNAFEKAEEGFSKAVDLDGKNVDYLLNLGLTRMFQKKYEQAEEPFKRVIAINPNDSRAVRVYVKVLELQKKYADESKFLLSVLQDPNNQNCSSWAYCAAISIKAKNFEQASDCLQKAHELTRTQQENDNVIALVQRLRESQKAVAEHRPTPDELADLQIKESEEKAAAEAKIAEQKIAEEAKAAGAQEKASQQNQQQNGADGKPLPGKSSTIIKLDPGARADSPNLNDINEQDNRSVARYK